MKAIVIYALVSLFLLGCGRGPCSGDPLSGTWFDANDHDRIKYLEINEMCQVTIQKCEATGTILSREAETTNQSASMEVEFTAANGLSGCPQIGKTKCTYGLEPNSFGYLDFNCSEGPPYHTYRR